MGRESNKPSGSQRSVAVKTIPIQTIAIQTVEVLTDGASAIYGSEAIAGVINIILRKDYKGGQVAATAGLRSHQPDHAIGIVLRPGRSRSQPNDKASGSASISASANKRDAGSQRWCGRMDIRSPGASSNGVLKL